MEKSMRSKSEDSKFVEAPMTEGAAMDQFMRSLRIGPGLDIRYRRMWIGYSPSFFSYQHDIYARRIIVIPLIRRHLIIAYKKCTKKDCLKDGRHVL